MDQKPRPGGEKGDRAAEYAGALTLKNILLKNYSGGTILLNSLINGGSLFCVVSHT